ncbi:MAG: hypothetical protein H7X97_09430 [Opitutaceae bacterium]|nr:hypothetical protein [Verrucomicrobiales bacterium]
MKSPRHPLSVASFSLWLFAAFLLLAHPLHAQTPAAKRVACVGDSITQGVGTANARIESYPAQLQRMLDEHWIIGNFGNSGSTLLNQGDKPYQKQRSFQDALNFKPDVVIIMLGTNDTKPHNWKFKDQFVADYKDLIGKFKALPSSPRIFICRPAFVPGAGNFGINEPVILEQIPIVDQIAKDEGAEVIDMHAALEGHDDLLPDRVHPNAAGANVMARAACKALTGKEFTGELSPVVPGS